MNSVNPSHTPEISPLSWSRLLTSKHRVMQAGVVRQFCTPPKRWSCSGPQVGTLVPLVHLPATALFPLDTAAARLLSVITP